MHNRTTFADQNPALARGIQTISSVDTDTPAAALDSLPCPRCGSIDTPAVGSGTRQHYASARCQHCDHFIQWLSTRPPAERQAPLSYLQALADDGSVPARMREASERIDVLKRAEVQI